MYTKIDALLWSDNKFNELSDVSKLTFIYLLTSPHRNVLGFYYLPSAYGAGDLGWEIKKFDSGLEELSTKGFIERCTIHKMVYVKNFLKYNPIENPNQVTGAVTQLNKLQPSNLETLLLSHFETLSKPLYKPLVQLLTERLGKGYTKQVEVKVEVEVKEKVLNTKVANASLELEKMSKLDETLLDFEKMRRSIKKPITERGKKLLMTELDKLAHGDDELKIAILNQSILNSYAGVFPLKNGNGHSKSNGTLKVSEWDTTFGK